MMFSHRLLPFVIVGSALALPARAQEPTARARELFLKNCASCHGERGDGQGTTQLDRPARSFMDGGFSFGNTPEALFKTISVGIPGTPMAGFDTSLSEEERKLVASYVVTLGPPIAEVKEEDMVLAVHDRPLVVRGHLPPLAEGLPHHPRGLLIGDPSGITFEYTVDDVRLLALRQGGFVKRTDWTGRGGTPLEPLGKVVHLVEGGKPEALFLSEGAGLSARLSSASQGLERAALEYHLVDARKSELVHVVETPRVLTKAFGTGFERSLVLAAARTVTLELRTNGLASGGELHKLASNGRKRACVARGEDGPYTCFVLALEQEPEEGHVSTRGQHDVFLKLAANSKTTCVLSTLVLSAWSPDVKAEIERWLAR